MEWAAPTRLSAALAPLPQDHRWCDLPREHQGEGCGQGAVQCGRGQGRERWPRQVSPRRWWGTLVGWGRSFSPIPTSSGHTQPGLEDQT